jgi:hypothetical protein
MRRFWNEVLHVGDDLVEQEASDLGFERGHLLAGAEGEGGFLHLSGTESESHIKLVEMAERDGGFAKLGELPAVEVLEGVVLGCEK